MRNRPESFETLVCVTGQHREMLDQVLKIFEIKPDYDLNIMKQGQDLYDVTSRVLVGMREVLNDGMPDVVLVHGDTTTSMAAALAAFYMQIPVGHVEAGLRTYEEDLKVQILERGFAWLDTGTVESLMQAAEFVQTVQNRQGVVISAPEEIAFYEKWITKEELIQSARMYGKSPYGEHLMRVAENRLIFQEEITYDDHRNRWSRIYR